MESDQYLKRPVDRELEAQYNLRTRHPERTAIYAGMTERSAAFRARTPGFASIPYGPEPACVIDFFAAPNAPVAAPVLFFVHGGYWRALDRSIFSYMAEAWLARGIHVAMPGYTLAPKVSVAQITAQVGSAIDLLRAEAPKLGIDSERILVSGHSAGAQLGANVLHRDGWQAAGFVGVSGVYDLAPLLTTSVNHDVHLDAASAHALSPMRQAMLAGVPTLCAVGAQETDGFRHQSRDYVEYLRGCQIDATYMEVPGRNHFNILDDLGDADYPLFKAACALLDRP